MNRYDFDLMAVATAALEEAENEVERARRVRVVYNNAVRWEAEQP